ncbi:hypothetical protein P775_03905 [Puniceibacterium antarcticum]|uniref:HTH araC/xylS-type domain-containing protein n=1 Tax=Puniceibacterium antarcticum TaxID=1206336 RepID=A0A2G8RKB0_9RHOB|nr:AraC family transcriptional regulator [Puniceibacterium antarcticum]PIL21518.1 hypothetical protein P775_03905 [Puniceibacterium antarcticum]
MSFHPRMYASVQGFEPLCAVRCLSFDQMTIDHWRVRVRAQAGGRYVSMHPRFVFILDGRQLSLTTDRQAAPQICACCYIPGGLEVWGRMAQSGELRHLDLHLSHRRLLQITGPDTPLHRPVFLPEAGVLAGLTALLTEETDRPCRSAQHTERLAEALIVEFFHHARTMTRPYSAQQAAFADVALYVRRNMEQRISVDQLATLSCMSRTGFNREFRAAMGTSPYQWVMQMKIAHAKQLLKQGVPFVQVADATGFADQAHFNRVFKAATGLAPGFWIKEQSSGAVGPNLQDIST